MTGIGAGSPLDERGGPAPAASTNGSSSSKAPLPFRRMPRPVREFLDTEVASGVVILAAAVVALVWANSPWSAAYESLWETELVIRLGDLEVDHDLRDWVNEGLMALFFFVAGLEIKRELVSGHLRDRRAAALPALAAFGGMAVPAVLYTAVNLGAEGGSGWGIPMATDIAFAVGVVALLGNRVPAQLKLFLLTLAVVDDVGAILVIAVFYADGLDPLALLGVAVVLGCVVVLKRSGVHWLPVYAVLAVALWFTTSASGLHATLAGVVLGLLTPARPLAPAALAREWAEDLSDEPGPRQLRALQEAAGASVSVVERLEHRLHPLASFVVAPLFALANAGVAVDVGALGEGPALRVAGGVVLGLVVGKAVGVAGATWLAVRLGVGRLPEGVRWAQVVGVAVVAGVGFTVALFVTSLSFDSPVLEDAAKVGILVASGLAAIGGAVLLARTSRPGQPDPSAGSSGSAPSGSPGAEPPAAWRATASAASRAASGSPR